MPIRRKCPKELRPSSSECHRSHCRPRLPSGPAPDKPRRVRAARYREGSVIGCRHTNAFKRWWYQQVLMHRLRNRSEQSGQSLRAYAGVDLRGMAERPEEQRSIRWKESVAMDWYGLSVGSCCVAYAILGRKITIVSPFLVRFRYNGSDCGNIVDGRSVSLC